MPEKVEGLSWGKKLSDGRQTFVVVTDNDFRVDQETALYVFAIPIKLRTIAETHVRNTGK